MTTDHTFKSAADTRAFILGGNALFTIESVTTGNRFTFKVRASADESEGVFFVSLLTGDNNETDYSYLGIIPKDDPLTFRLTRKSAAGEQAQSVVAFRWFWKQITSGRLPATVRVWHEGRCGRCGRTLTVPESIASGFGPKCIQHI